MILDEIVEYKKEFLKEVKQHVPVEEICAQAQEAQTCRDFKATLLQQNRIALIAEIKKASPSKGMIRSDLDSFKLAGILEASGADALSVLTDEKYFMGSLENLKQAKKGTEIPVLRKEFIIDPYQIYEAKVFGADAILLIAAILEDAQLEEFIVLANELGMAALVETHTAGEVDRVLKSGAEIIGINNRDLKTFTTDLKTTGALIEHIPKDRIIVSESGINTRQDVQYLEDLGVNAILVGESIMREGDISVKIQELIGG